LLDKLPAGEVLNFSDIYDEVFDTHIDKKYGLSYALLPVALLGLVYTGRAVVMLKDGTALSASNLESVPKISVSDIGHFKHISTPVGKYNPDWAIAFHEGKVKHIYFVAETKGSMSSMQLRLVEEAKIHCAREHFRAISSENVVYDVVDSYSALMDKVLR
jgi:hypothetical protein